MSEIQIIDNFRRGGSSFMLPCSWLPSSRKIQVPTTQPLTISQKMPGGGGQSFPYSDPNTPRVGHIINFRRGGGGLLEPTPPPQIGGEGGGVWGSSLIIPYSWPPPSVDWTVTPSEFPSALSVPSSHLSHPEDIWFDPTAMIHVVRPVKLIVCVQEFRLQISSL